MARKKKEVESFKLPAEAEEKPWPENNQPPANPDPCDSESDDPNPAPETEHDIRRFEDRRTVNRPFSGEQKEVFLGQLYELRRDYSHMQDELDYHKDLAKSAQKRIDSINDQMHKVVETLEAGREEADVPCEKVINYTTGMVTWFDQETGERVFERPLTETEKQMELDLQGEAGEPGEEPDENEPADEEEGDDHDREPQYPDAA